MTSAGTYALIHGAGDVGWYWHLLEAELRERGHDTVAPDLPVEDDSAGLTDYADVVIDAIGERRNLIVVAQSFGGYVAPIVCDRLPARLRWAAPALDPPIHAPWIARTSRRVGSALAAPPAQP